MSDIEFAMIWIFGAICIMVLMGVLMYVGIKFILEYLSDIVEELRKLNQEPQEPLKPQRPQIRIIPECSTPKQR